MLSLFEMIFCLVLVLFVLFGFFVYKSGAVVGRPVESQ